jgi:hypothetical protein
MPAGSRTYRRFGKEKRASKGEGSVLVNACPARLLWMRKSEVAGPARV